MPPISTFWAAINAETVLLEMHENYQKKSTRNRSTILGANGIEVLSVPLKKGKNSKMPIGKIEISFDDHWQKKHLQSIKSAYGNAPYFEYYFEAIEEIIMTKHKLLTSLNQALFEFFNHSLNLELNIKHTTTYNFRYGENDCDLRPIKFNQPQISGFAEKRYNQVFEEKYGFIGGISILDLLMCKGPESILYI